MKRFLSLVAVFLFALIVAGIYEVFYIRGGYVGDISPLNNAIQRVSSAYSGSDTMADVAGYARDFFSFDGVQKKQSDPRSDLTPSYVMEPDLTQDMSSGVLASDLDLSDISERVTDSHSYAVIEYCYHNSVLCQQMFDDGTQFAVQEQLGKSLYIRKPFIGSLDGIDAQLWKGEQCVRSVAKNKVDAYHTAIYQDGTITSLVDVIEVGKNLKIKGFTSCMNKGTNGFRIQQEMRQAKSLFGVETVPSIVIIEQETGKWINIPGLYDESEVEKVLRREF